MDEVDLHESVCEYKRTGTGRGLVERRIAERVYAEPGRYGFDSADDAADALLKYRARIGRMIDRFVDRGSPFDAYLAACLRYLGKTIRRERRAAAERELVCERVGEIERDATRGDESALDLFPPPLPGRPRRTRARPRRTSSAGRGPAREEAAAEGSGGLCPGPLLEGREDSSAYGHRLVFLFLKCAWDAEDGDVDRVASVAGVGADWLASALAQARRSLESERNRCELLGSRRNRSWCRLRLLEARMRDELDPERRGRIELAARRERERLERARAEMSALRPVVSNAVVARILGIPKGTVDSGLYYLKRRRAQAGR